VIEKFNPSETPRGPVNAEAWPHDAPSSRDIADGSVTGRLSIGADHTSGLRTRGAARPPVTPSGFSRVPGGYRPTG